jgi:nitrate reductase gamma subunit
MAPQAKESVRMNPLSYLAGVLYHGGVFAAFALLGLRLGNFHRPKALAAVALVGALGGFALFGKRLLKAHLRGLSSPDDFVSNILATAFATLAGAVTLRQGLESAWLMVAIALLVYMPIGKIRHCVFFFSTRYHSGAFFGRRGVFPPATNRPERG